MAVIEASVDVKRRNWVGQNHFGLGLKGVYSRVAPGPVSLFMELSDLLRSWVGDPSKPGTVDSVVRRMR